MGHRGEGKGIFRTSCGLRWGEGEAVGKDDRTSSLDRGGRIYRATDGVLAYHGGKSSTWRDSIKSVRKGSSIMCDEVYQNEPGTR